MTAKEKAQELVNKFYFMPSSRILYEDAKQCALIALEMEYEARKKAFSEMSEFCMDVACQAVIFSKKEYEQIKSEIENL